MRFLDPPLASASLTNRCTDPGGVLQHSSTCTSRGGASLGRTRLEVRRATGEDDLPADRDAAGRADHQRATLRLRRWTRALLRERLERWPGLKIEAFFLAWRGEELVGVTAPWDAHAVKRFRVEEYRAGMRWVRAAFNLGAFVLRYPPLPPPGSVLRYLYLTHVSVKDEDPAVMQALVDRIYADLHGAGYHFFTAFVLDDDPFAACYERYTTTPIPAQLFTVSPPGSPFNERDPGPGRPGFEMALV